MTQAMKRVEVQGKTVNQRTLAMLRAAERRLGYELTIVQGSYNTDVKQSAGTHNGGGAVDLLAWDHRRKVRALRTVGFAAWYRPELFKNGKRVWGPHIHAVAIGDDELSDTALAQVTDYRNGKDGLASHKKDNTWHPKPIPVFHFPPPRPPVTVRLKGVPGTFHVAGVPDDLPGLRGRAGPSTADFVKVDPKLRPNGFNLEIKRVLRFRGENWAVTADRTYYLLKYLKHGKA